MGRTPTGDEGRAGAVRVLLVEDHAVFRELFASAFDREPGFEVVAQVGALAGAREALEAEPVDVAVLDFELPDGEGTDLIGGLREKNPHAAALILTASLDTGAHARAVAAGAAGVLHKSADVGEVMDAIRRLAAGEALLSKACSPQTRSWPCCAWPTASAPKAARPGSPSSDSPCASGTCCTPWPRAWATRR